MPATVCRNCGLQSPPGAAVCARCQLPLDSVDAPPPAGRRGGSRGVLALLAVGSAAGAVAWLSLSKPSASLRSNPELVAAPNPSVPLPLESAESAPEPVAAPASVPATAHTDAPASPQPTAAGAAGSLPRSAILGVIRGQASGLRECYQAALARAPELSATITVKFVIGVDGQVTSAASESSDLKESTISRCLEQRFLRMRFPPPTDGPVTITYPIKLQKR
jgi:outer membrane biosynthesis protein TonB